MVSTNIPYDVVRYIVVLSTNIPYCVVRYTVVLSTNISYCVVRYTVVLSTNIPYCVVIYTKKQQHQEIYDKSDGYYARRQFEISVRRQFYVLLL